MINFIQYHNKTSNIIIDHNDGILEEMIAHGNSNLQDEVCGIGLGHKNNNIWNLTKFIPLDNVVKDENFAEIKSQLNANDLTDYIPHPAQWLNAISQTTHFAKDAEFDLVVLFHTHPHNHPRPSMTDIRGAGYEAVYIIYSPCYNEISYNYNNGVTRGFENAGYR